MSMAHSLEARVPVPGSGRVRSGARAAHLARRFAGCPRSVCSGQRWRRSSRAGSSALASGGSRSRPRPGCAASWRRWPASCWPRSAPTSQGYFEPGAVNRLLQEHLDRRQDHSRQLWGLMCFSLWAEQIERRPGAPPRRAPHSHRGLTGHLDRTQGASHELRDSHLGAVGRRSGRLTLNRPETLNAWTAEFGSELRQVVEGRGVRGVGPGRAAHRGGPWVLVGS